MLPTTPTLPFNKGEKTDNPIEMYLSDIFTIPISLAGIPSISVPIDFLNKLPIGLQLCSSYFKEDNIFALSQLLEDKFIN